MWRNVLLSTAAAALLAGCTVAEKHRAPSPQAPASESPAQAAPPAKPKTQAKPTRKPAPAPTATTSAAQEPPKPRQEVLPLVRAETAWLDYGRTFSARREPAATNGGVPLFRQAIVLASVRAALAGMPATPQAEFQNGLITLTFDRGTPQQIAAAVNRTLDTPEVSRLRVVLPP